MKTNFMLFLGETESGAASPASTTDSDSKDGSDKDKKPKKNRCHTCKKKVGLTGKKALSLHSGIQGG